MLVRSRRDETSRVAARMPQIGQAPKRGRAHANEGWYSPVTMPTAELIAIIGSVFDVGLALAVLIMCSTARVDADRRALQVAMDTFRTEMMRLAERQSRLDAIQEIRGLVQRALD